MTATTDRPGPAGHERRDTATPVPAIRIPTQRTPLDAGPAALFVPPVPAVDAAAALAPWTPPAPARDPEPARRAWVLLAVAVTVMIVGIATAVAFAMHAAPGTGTDARYLSSARAMSGLTEAEASDAQLVRVGSGACAQLDDLPTPAGLSAARTALQVRTGWTDHATAGVVAAAVGTYCVRHAELLVG